MDILLFLFINSRVSDDVYDIGMIWWYQNTITMRNSLDDCMEVFITSGGLCRNYGVTASDMVTTKYQLWPGQVVCGASRSCTLFLVEKKESENKWWFRVKYWCDYRDLLLLYTLEEISLDALVFLSLFHEYAQILIKFSVLFLLETI